jgi:hypothetical protein
VPRWPVAILLAASIVASGCRAPGDAAPRATQEQAALKEAWGPAPAPEEAHPVRDWIAEHPWKTAALATGAVAATAAVVVVVGNGLAAAAIISNMR